MEATKSIHVEELKIIEDFIKNNKVNSAVFNLNQYSSRMPDVKQGIYNSVFDFNLGKGSSFDLNVYPVELAIKLFAEDKNIEIKNITLIDEFTINNSILRIAPLVVKNQKTNAMWYELNDFIKLINNKDLTKMNYWLDITIESIRVLNMIENNN